MEPRPILFHCRVKEKRKAIGYSKRQFSGMIGFHPAITTNLNNIEKGMGCTLSHALKIAQALKTPVEELWTEIDKGDYYVI